MPARKPKPKRTASPQIAALVLQGGGALGAYEHGVVRRLFEEPNLDIRYVSGVSIGAISAAIVVGARNGDPVASLEALWDDLAIDAPFLPAALAAGLSNLGNAAFYRLRSDVFGLPFWTSFYDLAPIRRRLAALVDFDRIRDSSVRLVVTATNIATGEIVEFSNADPENPLTIDHILASGSLPPGFPMTAIGGDLYWDGGLFDNTPLSPLLKLIAPEDAARTRLFVVNLFPKRAPVPQNLAAVADRMIELIFANKLERDAHIAETINGFVQLVEEMVERHPEDAALLSRPEFVALRKYKALEGIVQITNTREEPANAASDFSRKTILARIAAGYADADRELMALVEAA
jgi:predicted acylesterase/phospholipase RssA